jgi:hypothetical protein
MAKDFTTTFQLDKNTTDVFNAIKNVRGWWSGLHGEEIEGKSDKINDEFTFRAGEGMHYSKQMLIELIPEKKIVWLVTDSKLNFAENKSEWTTTKICFEISKKGKKTEITFTHIGLVPKFECYNGCSSAWTQYLERLAQNLRSL